MYRYVHHIPLIQVPKIEKPILWSQTYALSYVHHGFEPGCSRAEEMGWNHDHAIG